MAYFPTREVNRLIGTGTSLDFPLVLFELLDDMIALGWRVKESSDRTTGFENEGQTGAGGAVDPGNPWGAYSVIRSGAGGANGLANQSFNVGSSWIRIATPADAAVYREYLWTLDYGGGISLADWRLDTTLDLSGFDSGGTIQHRPVAVDQICLAGNQVGTLPGNPSSADFRTWIPSATGNLSHWILGDKDDEYCFIYFNVRSSDQGVWGVWGLDQIVPAFRGTAPPGTIDPDPFYHLTSHASSSGNSFDWADASGGSGRSDLSALSGIRAEDRTGAQGQERGLLASMLLGEPGPPPEAGHYHFALGRHGEGDSTSFLDDIGISPGLGRAYSVNSMAVIKAAVAPRFFKGFARGRLVRGISEDSSVPNTYQDTTLPSDEQTRARFGNIGLSFPWPNGVGVST